MYLRGLLRLFLLPVFVLVFGRCFSQSLPEQDCVGAIPLCQTVYTTTNAYSGSGNIPNEINPTKSCLSSGEKNDAWYTFTAQTTGKVGFLITPFNGQDDYDWAVFNITNKPCSLIFTDVTMEVSCNYDANIGCGGVTGPNGTLSPCGQTEPLIPVTAGETYVVNVSNYSSSQNGYTIDFNSSTAIIYDNQPPQKLSLTALCSDKQLSLHFNEPVDCRTISSMNDDIIIADENGTYKNIPSIVGVGCSSNSFYTTTVNLKLDGTLSTSSEYYLIAKTGADGNSISDKCSNFFPLNDTIAVINPQNNLSLNLGNDILFCPEDVALPLLQMPLSNDALYTWTLNGQPLSNNQNELTISDTGFYTGTFYYGNMCSFTDTIFANYYQQLVVNAGNDSTVCTGQSLPLLTSSIGSGVYKWYLNGSVVSTANMFQPLLSGEYILSVAKTGFCMGADTVLLSTIPHPQINLGNDVGICSGDTVQLQINNTFNFYLWSLNGNVISVNPIINGITQIGNYILKTGINSTCFAVDTVVVFQKALTPVSLGNDKTSCLYDALPVIEATTTANTLKWYYNKNMLADTATSIQSVGAGNYIAVATAADFCTNSDTVQLTLSNVLPVNFGDDKIVCETNPVLLETNISSTGIFEWKRNGSLLSASSNTINITQSGEYSLYFNSSSGCTATDTIAIEVKQQLHQPVVTCPSLNNGKKLFVWNEVANAAGYEVSEDLGLNWLNTISTTSQTQYETGLAVNQLWVRAIGDSVCTVGKTGISSGCEVTVPTIIVSTDNNIFTIKGAETPLQIFITDATGRNVFFAGDYKNNFSLTGLAEGFYMYKIKSGKAKYQTGKFLFLK